MKVEETNKKSNVQNNQNKGKPQIQGSKKVESTKKISQFVNIIVNLRRKKYRIFKTKKVIIRKKTNSLERKKIAQRNSIT